MNGFLNMLKPPGMSSNDLVGFVRRRLPRGTRVGHGGTLDPEAAGVLPVCVGRATRLFDYVIDKEKEYIAELRLGLTTDTQDATGSPVDRRDASLITEEAIRGVLPAFTGDIRQIPPAFSAIKRDGRRMYDLARKGQAVELEARDVHVESIEYMEALEMGHLLKIVCGKGVYIRTLCHDIGQALGVGGHMAFLLRTRAGAFTIENAITPEELDAAAQRDCVASLLLAPDLPLQRVPAIRVSGEYAHAVINGNPLKPGWYAGNAAGTARVYLEDRFAGMAEIDADGTARFKAMLMERETCE